MSVHTLIMNNTVFCSPFCSERTEMRKAKRQSTEILSKQGEVLIENLIENAQVQARWKLTRMWAIAQRDGRPAKYRWRPLFNAAKFV